MMMGMYEPEESIYNLIPPEEVRGVKQKRHKSKYNPKLPPTGSTFGNGTTSKLVGNMNGDYVPQGGAHQGTAKGTWGKPLGQAKPKVDEFTKRGTGTMKLTKKRKILSFIRSNFRNS